MEDQDEFLIRKSECEEVGLETNNDNIKAALEDVLQLQLQLEQNADLYIANQEGNTQNQALAELWTTSNDEVVGCFSFSQSTSSIIIIKQYMI